MDPAPSSNAPARTKSIWPMFAAVLVLFVLFAAVVQWMLRVGNREVFDEEAIRSVQRYEILKKVTDQNAALTTGYAWEDRAKGIVRIPLDRAMELAVAKLAAQGAPKPAYPVDPAVSLVSALKPGGLAAPAPTPPPFPSPAAAPTPAQATLEVNP